MRVLAPNSTQIPNEILDNLPAFTDSEARVIVGMYYVAQRDGCRPGLEAVQTFTGLDDGAFSDGFFSLLRRGLLDTFMAMPVRTQP